MTAASCADAQLRAGNIIGNKAETLHFHQLLSGYLNRLDVLHSLFGHTEEEYIPDAESVYLHREQHHQPQACTLAQCFQLYTKEEQVTPPPYTRTHTCARLLCGFRL